ncbi:MULTISPECIES: YjjG family noncanonical pyrimidine nucleotidase [unclassified Ruminococcus]|uniref:YjjG family noncanonical pyrimidine nucleotidase n=1 Tax=unclassified Ruminococcus TaxID=2608920 RepID=UPI00210B04DE|nr:MULTISPECIES: YjjG family noncanonical pyrimidine nucleotidase [unclassified Ruminococcus]
MNKLAGIKYIFLDADETLLDFTFAEHFAFKSTMEHFSIPYSEGLYGEYSAENLRLWKLLEKGELQKQRLLTLRFENVFNRNGITISSVDEVNNCFFSYMKKCGKIIDNADKLCESLRRDYKLYIATNGSRYVAMGRLEQSGLLPYITDVFISDYVGYNKPSKKFFDYCFDKIGDYDRSRYIILGDSLSSDMLGGKNAGIITCLYDPKDKTQMPNELCNYKIDSLLDFKELLKKGEKLD